MPDKKPENPFAFPAADVPYTVPDAERGMTLRDWFAGQALPAHVYFFMQSGESYTDEEVAEFAYQSADAMLKEREDKV